MGARPIDEIVAEKNEDEEMAAACEIAGMDEDTQKQALDSKPVCMKQETEGSYNDMYMKHAALTWAQVVHEYGKTPKVMNLDCVRSPGPKPQIVYLCERTAAFKTKYPTLKLGNKFACMVLIRNADGSSRMLYSRQPQIMLESLPQHGNKSVEEQRLSELDGKLFVSFDPSINFGRRSRAL